MPEELKQKWIKWLEEMQLLTLKPDVDVNDFTTELHLFADAPADQLHHLSPT